VVVVKRKVVVCAKFLMYVGEEDVLVIRCIMFTLPTPRPLSLIVIAKHYYLAGVLRISLYYVKLKSLMALATINYEHSSWLTP
jgi:hypothetical protein